MSHYPSREEIKKNTDAIIKQIDAKFERVTSKCTIDLGGPLISGKGIASSLAQLDAQSGTWFTVRVIDAMDACDALGIDYCKVSSEESAILSNCETRWILPPAEQDESDGKLVARRLSRLWLCLEP